MVNHVKVAGVRHANKNTLKVQSYVSQENWLGLFIATREILQLQEALQNLIIRFGNYGRSALSPIKKSSWGYGTIGLDPGIIKNSPLASTGLTR